MISKFTIQNLTTKEIITFGQDIDSDFVYTEDGLDWGSSPALHNTYAYPGQIGVSISTTNIMERDISITGFSYYVLPIEEARNMSHKERVDYCYEKILEKKKKLNEMIHPMQYVRVTVGDYYIDGKPSNTVSYGRTGNENNEYFCKFLINIYCNEAVFRKKTITQTILSGDMPNFKFPLIFPEGKGIMFGIRRTYKLVAVYNEGVAAIGAKITLKAHGVVTNPKVENVQTGESLKIDKTLVDGEVIVINTESGESRGVKGYLNDVEYNYFKYWDFDNDWMMFPHGTSLVGYSLGEGDETLLEVIIEINPRKFVLEEM